MGIARTERKALAPEFNGIRPPAVISVEAYQDEPDDQNWMRSKRDIMTTWWYTRSPQGRMVYMGLSIMAVVGIIVAIVLAATSGEGSSSAPVPVPMPVPDPLPTNHGPIMDDPANRESNIIAKLEKASTLAALKDKSSPQYAALRWIVDNDSMQLQSTSPYLTQRYALAVIFNALGGSEWSMKDLWIDDADDAGSECMWQGVECDGDSLVHSLFLNEMGLKGKLPNEVAALSHLKKLDLRDNKLSGSLPKDISNLKHLTLLLLEGNIDLSGSVPDGICQTVQWVTVVCDVMTCHCCANCNGDNVTIGINGPVLSGNVTAGRTSLINTLLGPLSPESKTPGTPQNTALNWILYGDNRKLSVNDDTLIQRYVLAVLYYSLSGDEWSNGSSWLTEDSECTFAGIACNEFGFVTTIAMVHNNLKGTLPLELGLLDELGFLDLSNNFINGVIPAQLSELDSLESLLLQGNDIGGSVPSQVCMLTEGNLWEFKTDCGSFNPKVKCSCCANCDSVVDDGSELNTGAAGERGEDGAEEIPKLDYFALFGRRGESVASVVETVSEEIYVADSSRADAMEWILKEDPMSLEHDDKGLIQRWILALLHFQLGGANWVYTNYLTGASECEWDGIKCDDNNLVTEIVLPNGGLMGAVPYELGSLEALKLLDLHGNFIEGEAPEEFCVEKEDVSHTLETIIFDCMDPPLVDCDCCTPCTSDGSNGGSTGGTTLPSSPQTIDYLERFGRRGQRIAEALEDLSEDVYTRGSSRAAAAEWIIEKDTMRLEHSDSLLTQRFLLALLYFQLDGPNWMYSNFLTGDDECTWDGITCNEDEQVIEIILPDGGLLGVVPFELGALDTLKVLDLHGNRIEGEAPEEFCNDKEDESMALEKLIFDCMDPPLVECECCTPCRGDAGESSGSTGGKEVEIPVTPQRGAVDYETHGGRRGVHIATQLSDISDRVNEAGTGEASATIWLVRDDPMQLEHDDEGLLQRWIIALLYFRTDGPNWKLDPSSFLTAESECSWEGITCDGHDIVTSIILRSIGLLGMVPPELAMLESLTTLDLRDNRLEGDVPDDICLIETVGTLVLDCGDPPLVACDCCSSC